MVYPRGDPFKNAKSRIDPVAKKLCHFLTKLVPKSWDVDTIQNMYMQGIGRQRTDTQIRQK